MPLKDYNSVSETAAYLGFSTKTVMNWIKAGKLKAIQPFGKRGTHKITRQAIEELMEANSVKP